MYKRIIGGSIKMVFKSQKPINNTFQLSVNIKVMATVL